MPVILDANSSSFQFAVSDLASKIDSSLNMAFTSNFNSNFTSLETPSWMDLGLDGFEPLRVAMTSFIAIFVSFLAYLSYTPKVDKRAPAFTSDTVPFIGSWNFFTQKM